MFELKESIIQKYKALTLCQLNGKCALTIIPELGACLYDLTLSDNNQKHKVLENWNEHDNFTKTYEERYIGAQLFPFPNRLANGSYFLDGQQYQFAHNDFGRPNALHGLLTHEKFEVSSVDLTQGSITLMHKRTEKHKGYPFNYEINLKFTLSKSKLEIYSKIINQDDLDIPVGYGWHPYFSLNNQALNQATLSIPKCSKLELDSLMIPNKAFKKFDTNQNLQLNEVNLDDCFKFEKENESIKLTTDFYQLELQLGNYKFAQIYLPPDKKAIAIEPQTCAPDAFNNLIGLQTLQSGAFVEYNFKIKLS